MADNHPWHGSDEYLTRPRVSALPGAKHGVTESARDHVTGTGAAGASHDSATSHDSAARAGCAASGRGERMLFDNGIFSIARRGDPVQFVLAGELDLPSVPYLTAALLGAACGSRVLHIDLADVYFCDLAALRAIIGLGQPSEDGQPPPARSVILHNVPVHIENVMRIVGWDTTPGLIMDTGGTSSQEPGR